MHPGDAREAYRMFHIDGTTLRPVYNQQTIDDDVTFSVGNSVLASCETVATL